MHAYMMTDLFPVNRKTGKGGKASPTVPIHVADPKESSANYA